MPSNRTPLNRQRSPIIDAETLALFVELESAPKRRRDSQKFKDRDRELARRLGLGGEWLCDVTSVTDAERQSLRTGMHHDAWLKVRAERLLAMAGLGEQRQTKAS